MKDSTPRQTHVKGGSVTDIHSSSPSSGKKRFKNEPSTLELLARVWADVFLSLFRITNHALTFTKDKIAQLVVHMSFFLVYLGGLKTFLGSIIEQIQKMHSLTVSTYNENNLKNSIKSWQIAFTNSVSQIKEYHPKTLVGNAKGYANEVTRDFLSSVNEGLLNSGVVAGQGVIIGVLDVIEKHEHKLQKALSTIHDDILYLSAESGRRSGAGLLEGAYRQLLSVTKNMILVATPLLIIMAFVRFAQRIFFEKTEVKILN